MHVAVVIVGFRNPEDIVGCLQALGRSTHADFEVVICENGGEAAFRALRAAAPETLPGGQAVRTVLAPGNLGYAGGVNIGLRETPSADAWWILNPDTAPDPEAMALMTARLARGDCDVVGSVIHTPAGKLQCIGGLWRARLARAVSLGNGEGLERLVDLAPQVEARQNYVHGASMLVGRRWLEAVGPMREDYFLYCEEVEWCLRGLGSGLKLGFAPGALILHHQGTTTGATSDIRRQGRLPVYLNERNRLLLTRDCFPGQLLLAAPASLALILLRFARRGAWRQVGYALSGWWAGLLDRRGVPAWAR